MSPKKVWDYKTLSFIVRQKRDLICQKYHNGEISLEELGEQMGLSKYTAYDYYIKSAYHKTETQEAKKKRQAKLLKDRYGKAEEMARKGLPLKLIAKEAGVHVDSLRKKRVGFYEGKETLAGLRRKAINKMKEQAHEDIEKSGKITSKIVAMYPQLSLHTLYRIKNRYKKNP